MSESLPWPMRVAIYLFVQALMYGLYISSFIHCLRCLLFEDDGWHIRKRISWLMLAMAALFFSLLTIDLVCTFVFSHPYDMQASEFYYMHGALLLSGAAKLATTLVADAVLIYRCWIVYSQSRLIICLPVILWIYELACLVFNAYWLGIGGGNTTYHSVNVDRGTLSSFYACSAATTIYSTTAIVYRISRIKRSKANQSKRLQAISSVIAESGVLFTLTSLITVITVGISWKGSMTTALTDGFAMTLTAPITSITSGIAFNLIYIRVSQQRDSATDSYEDLHSRTNQ